MSEMTIERLIEELSLYPMDAVVGIVASDGGKEPGHILRPITAVAEYGNNHSIGILGVKILTETTS